MAYLHPNTAIIFKDLGLMPYQEAWDLQDTLLKEKVASKIAASAADQHSVTVNHLFFCEHPHVYTLGKSGKGENLLINDTFLRSIEAEYVESNRGGDITYHGPGQLVVYPVLDLEHFYTDIHKYMRSLEEVVILTCAEFGIVTGRSQGFTGVWLDAGEPTARKICAMGVKTSRWVTMHGLALNVNINLSYFNHIVPCGIEGKAVTSMAKELGGEVPMQEVKIVLLEKFLDVFQAQLEILS